jgi:hypothetical protein
MGSDKRFTPSPNSHRNTHPHDAKSWQQFFERNLSEFLECIFACNYTTSEHHPHTPHVHRKRVSFRDQHTQSTHVHHILKPRAVTYVGGKTTYGHRLSTLA